MSGLGRQVMQVTAEYKREVEHRISCMKVRLQALKAEQLNDVRPTSARGVSSKLNSIISSRLFEDPLASFNAKITA